MPAAICAGTAAWCSLGTIGLVGSASTRARVVLLPPWWLLPIFIVGIAGAIVILRLSPRERSPLFGAAILLLPWLPIRVPAALLLWTGPAMVMVWIAIMAGILLARAGHGGGHRWSDRRRGSAASAVLSLVLYGASAWWLSPILPDGDEPHYLILAQSLIKDGDIKIENNHQRGDYLDYSLNAAAPDYLRRGVNGEIYSIHAPGLAVVIAPAMWLFGYPGVVAFLGCVAALSTALVWNIAHRLTGSGPAAWFGWACCALTTPFFFQSTEVFPDGIAATCLLLGILPLLTAATDEPSGRSDQPTTADTWVWTLSGMSLAVLPWLQTRLAVLAVAAAACLSFRIRTARQLIAFAVAPLTSAVAWFGFFVIVYGTPNPTAPYGPYTQTSVANLVRGLPGLLIDQQFGLIPNAPAYGFILVGVLAAAMKWRRWAWETLALVLPYMVAVGTYQMWWGGTSVPGRLLASTTLVLGLAAARIWHHSRTDATRVLGVLGLITSLVITAVLVGPGHGRLLLNFRDGISLWLEWANDTLDLPKGLPSLFRDDPSRFWTKTVVWAAAGLTAWIALSFVHRRGQHERTSPVAALSGPAIWGVAAAVMLAFTLSWHFDGTTPLTVATSEIGLLQHASPFRSRAFDLGARRTNGTAVLLTDLEMTSDRQRRPAALPTLFSARDLPAGTYRLRVTSSQPPAAGTLTVRVGATPLALKEIDARLAQQQPADEPIVLAASVRSLMVDGDDAAARTVTVALVSFARADWSDAGGSAHRAARYDSAEAFFLDDNAYPEPTGFWVAGGRTTVVTIGGSHDGQQLLLRNAPRENRVTVDVDGDRQELILSGGEERLVTLPDRASKTPRQVRIKSLNGFRPSATDPSSRDGRYLGCWVEIR